VGFVDGLFEMYKVRELIAKTKAEIISDGMASNFKHKFGTNLFTNYITFRSAQIENLVLDKRLELDKQKKVEGSLLIYDYLILQHAAMKCILKRRYSQFALVALVRSAMVLANQEFLLALMVRRNNWRQKVNTTIKNKTETQKKKRNRKISCWQCKKTLQRLSRNKCRRSWTDNYQIMYQVWL